MLVEQYLICLWGGDAIMTIAELEKLVEEIVRQILSQNAEFSNVARPKATKPSTATQGAWNIDKKPKASAATEGAWDATDTPGGVSSNAKNAWNKLELEAQVRKALTGMEFSNVVPTEPPKASTATQGAWDATNTPGGVSKFAKKVWTIEEVESKVRKALEKVDFYNNPTHPYPTKTSASSTQVITEHVPSKKLSASTQPSWKKEEEISNKVSASVIAQILTNVYKLDV